MAKNNTPVEKVGKVGTGQFGDEEGEGGERLRKNCFWVVRSGKID